MSNKEFYPVFLEREDFNIGFEKVDINSQISPDYNLLEHKPKIESVTFDVELKNPMEQD